MRTRVKLCVRSVHLGAEQLGPEEKRIWKSCSFYSYEVKTNAWCDSVRQIQPKMVASAALHLSYSVGVQKGCLV